MGYKNSDVYLAIALLEKEYDFNSAENYFLKALDLAETNEIKWFSLATVIAFYIENGMYMKAEKYIKKIMLYYPDNYEGFHLHIMIKALRETFEETTAYMNKLPEKFKSHPQYLIDYIAVYKKFGMQNKLHDLFENNSIFKKIIPYIVLREKIISMPNDDGNDSTKEREIRKLASVYHDSDAILSVMILEFSKRNFKNSAIIANVVLYNERKIYLCKILF